MIKAVLIDFDGTVVTEDLLTKACELVGKKQESLQLTEDFNKGRKKGFDPLIERIDFLKGMSVADINSEWETHDYLTKGAVELFDFLNKNKIISILTSGNIVSTLEFYQKKLGISYIVGSKPEIEEGIIQGISADSYSGHDFKLQDCIKILERLSIEADEVVAIGDSPADRTIFKYARTAIAISPCDSIEKETDYGI